MISAPPEKGKKMEIAILIKNCICVFAWIALAIHFDKWWIALFAAMFMTSWTTTGAYYRSCDGCGRRSEMADSYNAAVDKAEKAGWLRMKNGDKWEDYCPACQAKRTRKGG